MVNVGDMVVLGSWPQELEGPALPCVWQVLELRSGSAAPASVPDGAAQGGMALLVSRDIIECRSYHDARGGITWQNSHMRYWLNAVFFPRAFSPREQACVQLEECRACNNDTFRTHGGGDTEDYVFCLSIEQAQRLFSNDKQRCARPTPYARRNAGTCWWWLRDPGGHQFSCAAVAETGRVDCNGFHASLDCIGVRPAVVVSLEAFAQVESARAADWAAQPAHAAHDAGHAQTAAVLAATGVGIDFPHAGAALRYGDEAQATALLGKEHLRAETASWALSGGNPSIVAVNHLIDQGIFTHADLFHLCLAAVRAGASNLAARLIEQEASQGALDENRLRRLLKAAVEKGSVPLAEQLLAEGASGAGFAAAYLKSGVGEAVAQCAFLADPAHAFERWDVLQTLPQTLRFMVNYCNCQGKLDSLVELSDLLATLAAAGALDELRLVCSSAQAVHAFASDDFSQAIAAAKAASFGAAVAFLLDAQAAQFGGSRVMCRPNLAL